jgi:tRNA A-37 threonylcarbamoyl transferase component Bud32
MKKNKSPILINAKIRKGRVVGKGQKEHKSQAVREVFIKERMGKKGFFHGVVKRFLPSQTYNQINARQAVINSQLAHRAFLKLGLPVAKIAKADLRTKSKNYLNIFYENLERKYGKLYDCHKKGVPKFLERFTVEKDKKLLKDLGSDLAKIHSSGYITGFIDFWNFYKKGETYGRVIVDFDNFMKDKNNALEMFAFNNLFDIRNYLGPREFNEFINSYYDTLTNNELKQKIKKHYQITDFRYLDDKHHFR